MKNQFRPSVTIALALVVSLCAAGPPARAQAVVTERVRPVPSRTVSEFAARAATQAVRHNPALAGDYPDPSVIRVGRDYWATATTGGWAPHFPILHSRDLVNWRPAGYVFPRRPAWTKRDFWAPEITRDRERFLVFYTARREEGPGRRGTLCVAVATSRQPAGPYTDHGPLVCQEAGSIDAFFMRDERGRPYLVWKEDGNDRQQPTVIWAQRLAADLTRVVGQPTELFRNDAAWERHVVEGSYILRRDGWFYHFYSGNACCGRECDYALGVARARKLLGPWEKNPANPILQGNERWRCPGHGSIVRVPQGRDYLLYHAYERTRGVAHNFGREGLLDEVVWDGPDGWPTINAGRGPSSSGDAPLGVAGGAATADFLDDFLPRALGLDWQWPMSSPTRARIEPSGAGRDGELILTAVQSAAPNAPLDAVLARRVAAASYEATALLDARSLRDGAQAGLAAYGSPEAAVGVGVGDGRVVVWRRRDGKRETLATEPAPGGADGRIHLRMTNAGGERYRFGYSVDGRTWRELGGEVDAAFLEGARLALYAGGAAGASARFDWARLSNARRG